MKKKDFWAGAHNIMRKWYFWPALALLFIICIAVCASAGLYEPQQPTLSAPELPVVVEDSVKELEFEEQSAKTPTEKTATPGNTTTTEADNSNNTTERQEEAQSASSTETKASSNPQTPPPSTPAQNPPSNAHYVHGYCKDGTPAYGDPTARGKANVCYGHKGWRDEY